MPPFSFIDIDVPHSFRVAKHGVMANQLSDVVTIRVGGQIFQTSKQTLTVSGSKLLNSLIHDQGDRFLDRDSDLFSILLSLLRTGTLPSKARLFDLEDLIAEAQFYGIEHLLIRAISCSELFEPFNLEKALSLPLPGRDFASAMSATSFGSLHVAHGSKITSFDWALRTKSTILTEFPAIDSLVTIKDKLVAAGATDFYGMQVIDLNGGIVRKRLDWENMTKSGSTVQAIGSSPDLLFTSFEAGRRNSNCIVAYDINSFSPVAEIGHSEVYGANLGEAIPATKLEWAASHGLLMAAGSHGGPSGFIGNVRLWDVRSGAAVWELKEGFDCFSDITFSENWSSIFKVGLNSGDVCFADLRKLGAPERSSPWICLGEKRKTVANGKKEGLGCKIAAHGGQVFVSRGGDIELWSEVMMTSPTNGDVPSPERVFRRNVMGRASDRGLPKITHLGFGGNKMFVTRSCRQSIEVWQSSVRDR